MSTAQTQERPVALVVEDRKTLLDTRRKMLALHGFQAIGAQSVSEALREFRATPAIDIVVTDINLDEANRDDRSGIDLARAVRDRRPHLPVVAISGQFDTLDQDEQRSFDDYLLKGTLSVKAFEAKLGTWRARALSYRQLRADKARSELTRMRQADTSRPPDIEVLRDFLPGGHLTSLSSSTDEFETPDDMLRREGWKLRLVETGFPISDDDLTIRTGVAVPFWLRQDGDVTIALLHGHSCIYHDGPDEEAAVKGALELMLGYAEEFRKEAHASYSLELRELGEYLVKVFG